MTATSKGRPPKIDQKLAYELWMEHGTLKNAAVAYEKETGEHFTHLGIHRAASNYMLFHMKEVRERFIQDGHKWENDVIWYNHMISTALRVFNSPKYSWKACRDWFFSQEEMQPYVYLFKPRYERRYNRSLEDISEPLRGMHAKGK